MSVPRLLLQPAARALARPAVLPRSASRALSSSVRRASDKAPSHAAVNARLSRASNKLEADANEHIGHDTTGSQRKVGKHTQRTLASFSMENKTCVVTGGTRGLGNLIARTFVESGASRLAILDLDAGEAQAAAAEVVQWFEDHGQAAPGEVEALGIGCNVASEESVRDAMAQIKERFGSIDVVVNSAGIVHNFPAEEYPTDKMKLLYDVNINGSYFVAREAAKHMLRDGTQGSIILIASMSAGIVNIPQAQAPYNASKAAVRHLASSLAVEWAKRGIRVNSLSPGYMATALTKQVLENSPEGKELKAKWESLTPMGRMGEPEDLKGAAIYLASDASKFTTGQDIVVDGGYVCV